MMCDRCANCQCWELLREVFGLARYVECGTLVRWKRDIVLHGRGGDGPDIWNVEMKGIHWEAGWVGLFLLEIRE